MRKTQPIPVKIFSNGGSFTTWAGELTLSAGVWSPKKAASSRFRVPSPLASQVPHSVAKMATDSKAFVTWRIFQR